MKVEKKVNGTFTDLVHAVHEEISLLEEADRVADKAGDRGAKRVITWASKTANVMKMILETYEKKGIDYILNSKIWVCDICGFVFIGDVPPKVCPICKVPGFKILEVV